MEATDGQSVSFDGGRVIRALAARWADPLGEGHPCTWRSLLIKVAAEVTVSTRRILVHLSAAWPYLDWYRRLVVFLNSLRSIPAG
jgi:hypothetical protein